MTQNNTLYSVCRSRNITLGELAALVSASPSGILYASQGRDGSAPLRQQIAEALGATCWEDLLCGSKRTVQAKTDVRQNMRCLVVLENDPPEVLYCGGGAKMYLFDGLFYVESRFCGKLHKRQFFSKDEACIEFAHQIRKG